MRFETFVENIKGGCGRCNGGGGTTMRYEGIVKGI
jgi:hypothetical protein